jgi:hypothetical protein
LDPILEAENDIDEGSFFFDDPKNKRLYLGKERMVFYCSSFPRFKKNTFFKFPN